jgi:high-affinity iron transporter
LEIFFLLGLLFSLAGDKMLAAKNWIIAGIALGVIGSGLLAMFTATVAGMFNGLGQEIFNSSILFFTAITIAHTIVYSSASVKAIKSKINNLGAKEVALSNKIIFALVIAAVIFREGVEIVLFTYSVFLSNKFSLIYCVIGVAGGFTAALICFIMCYKGLLRNHKIFKVTSLFFSLIAAGLSSQAVGILVGADIISFGVQTAWDSSQLIPDNSLLGIVLKFTINYVSAPCVLEVVAFVATLGLIVCGKAVVSSQEHKK